MTFPKIALIDCDGLIFVCTQGSIRYEIVGDMPAPNYFDISEESGAISVKADLKTDDEMTYSVSTLHLLIFA